MEGESGRAADAHSCSILTWIMKRSDQEETSGAAPGSPGQPAPLELGLLGPWAAWLHGQPLPPLRTRRGQWLLALLVLHQGRSVERDWLAGLLWPDSPDP